MTFFRLEIRFSQWLSTLYLNGIFSMRLFYNSFLSKPPSIFIRNETFCENKGLHRIFGTMRLAGDLHFLVLSDCFKIIALYPNFDVISEVNCVLFREADVRKNSPICSNTVYPNFDTVSEKNALY